MGYKNILFNVEEEIATITFNRPKVLNAMNSEVLTEILDVAMTCEKDDKIKALILTGAGDKAFVAGADISQMQNSTTVEIQQLMELGHRTLRLIETMPKPSIAAVNGFALGGGRGNSAGLRYQIRIGESGFRTAGNFNRRYSRLGGHIALAQVSRHGDSQRNDFKRSSD